MSNICKTLYECCEDHLGCSCSCKKLNLIYFNFDKLFKKNHSQKSVDCLRYSNNSERLYLIEIKNQPAKNIEIEDIIGKIKDTINYLNTKIKQEYKKYKFYLVISDNEVEQDSSRKRKLIKKLKLLGKGLYKPFYRIEVKEGKKYKIDNRVIKCSQTDIVLK